MIMKGKDPVGRFSVEFTLSNYADVLQAELGQLSPEKVRSVRLNGVVDTGATRLVLPAKISQDLGLQKRGETSVRYADNRREKRLLVRNALVEMLGREGNFSAILEPDRKDALIGAIVLEELDLIVDCSGQKLVPRDPNEIISEIE